jgi:hypothetical protein
MPRRRITIAAATAGAATLAAAVLAGAPHAQSAPTVLLVKEVGRAAIVLDDLGPKGMRKGKFSLGDRLLISQPVTRDGTRGTLTAVATVSTPGRVPASKSRGIVSAVYHFADGDLYLEGRVDFADDSGTGAVVGGTGVYAGARGTLESTKAGDRITLVAP